MALNQEATRLDRPTRQIRFAQVTTERSRFEYSQSTCNSSASSLLFFVHGAGAARSQSTHQGACWQSAYTALISNGSFRICAVWANPLSRVTSFAPTASAKPAAWRTVIAFVVPAGDGTARALRRRISPSHASVKALDLWGPESSYRIACARLVYRAGAVAHYLLIRQQPQ